MTRDDVRVRVFLETERLRLREFNESDVDNLVRLDSDPEVMHFITGGRPTPRHEIEEHVLPRFLRYHLESPGIGCWAVEEKESNTFIGWFHFRPGDGHPIDQPELGYRLVRAAWGRGYATEGGRALIDNGFRELGISRVVAETMVVHSASRRVMEKLGLRPVRFFFADWPDPIPGDEQGDVEYAIERAEWEQQSLT